MGGEAISGAALQFNLSNGTAHLGSDSRVNGSQGLTFRPGRLCQFPQLAAITHHAKLALLPISVLSALGPSHFSPSLS